jgi:hypothetical protein
VDIALKSRFCSRLRSSAELRTPLKKEKLWRMLVRMQLKKILIRQSHLE